MNIFVSKDVRIDAHRKAPGRYSVGVTHEYEPHYSAGTGLGSIERDASGWWVAKPYGSDRGTKHGLLLQALEAFTQAANDAVVQMTAAREAGR